MSMFVNSESDERTSNNDVRHQYRVLSDAEKAAMVRVKDFGLEFLKLIDDVIPAGRQASLAKTKVQAAGREVELPMRASPEPAQEDEGVLELKRQLSNQQAMTNRAAQIARDEHNARIQAERGLSQSNVSMVDQAIEAAKRDSDQARSYFQNALDCSASAKPHQQGICR